MPMDTVLHPQNTTGSALTTLVHSPGVAAVTICFGVSFNDEQYSITVVITISATIAVTSSTGRPRGRLRQHAFTEPIDQARDRTKLSENPSCCAQYIFIHVFYE